MSTLDPVNGTPRRRHQVGSNTYWTEVTPQLQATNGCGTASLAMILTAFSTDSRYRPDEIDTYLRNVVKLHVTPQKLSDFAEELGLKAAVCNKASFEFLQQGTERPMESPCICQCLVDAPRNSSGSNMAAAFHYVAVDRAWEGPRSDSAEPDLVLAEDGTTPYPTRPTDRGQWVQIKDPHDVSYVLSYDAFARHYWGRLKVGLDTGLDRFVIVYGTRAIDWIGDLADPVDIIDMPASITVASGAEGIFQSFVQAKDLFNLEPSGTVVGELAYGVIKTIGGAATFLADGTGRTIQEISEEGMEESLKLFKSGSIEKVALGSVLMPVSGAGWVTGTVLRTGAKVVQVTLEGVEYLLPWNWF